MAEQHTPGPWAVLHNPNDRDAPAGFKYFIHSDGYGVVGYWTGHKQNHKDERWCLTEADARLIAAAPDLLAALEAIVNVGECYSTEYDGRMYDVCFCCGAEISEDKPHKPDCEWIAARAAIAKARGHA